MGTWINKKSYQKLITEDIERLEKDMEQCPERDHIKAILKWSTKQLYDRVEAINTSGNSILPIQRVSNNEVAVCDCAIPSRDADNECCTICGKLLYDESQTDC